MRYKVIALTGGIGSGKTAVSGYLSSCGVPVYDSDSATKRLYDTNPVLVDKIEEGLGCKLRKADGSLDKGKLAKVIFSSPEALEKLESIVHPAVLEDFQKWMQGLNGQWDGYAGLCPFVVMESAIILGKPLFHSLLDAIVYVDAPLEQRIIRSMNRDGKSREEIEKRIAAQSFDMSMVDEVILNDSDLNTLYERTDIAFKNIIFA